MINVFSSALAAVLLASAASASAQNFPTRPITMVVPFAAGGPGDTRARILAEHMRGTLGQPIIVENVTGAGGSIGVGRVAQAAGDGYTLSVGNWSTHVVNGAVYSLKYDVVADFEPVGLVSAQPLLLLANDKVPANSLRELIAWLKANPGKATLGNSGIGSASHVAAMLFQRKSDTSFQLVPYRGSAQSVKDLIAGQIDLTFDQRTNALPHVQAGRIKAFAVTAPARLAAAPDIPTMDEAGLPDMHVSVWGGLWAAKNTPKPVIERLSAAVMAALADPTVKQRLLDIGYEVPPREEQTPAALAAYQRAEIARWWPIIKAAGIKAD
jgi:tripartite-type tricarboxylate transporter receptor subunit TctC